MWTLAEERESEELLVTAIRITLSLGVPIVWAFLVEGVMHLWKRRGRRP